MNPAHANQSEHALLKNYLLDHAYDEMFAGRDELHPHYEPLFERFSSLPIDELQRRKHSAELSFLNQGITFTVYGRDDGGKEHIFPYDLVPRIITAAEWATVEVWPDPAHYGSQPLSEGHLQRGPHPEGRDCAPRDCV